MHFKDYVVLYKRLFFTLSFFVFFRLVFYFYNYSYFNSSKISETLIAFFYGLRFDLATVLIVNIFFIIASILPFYKYGYQVFKKILFILFNSAAFIFLIADFEFFGFLGKKITIDALSGGMGGDVKDQLFQISVNYWHLTLFIVLTSFVLNKYYPRRKKDILLVPFLPWYKVILFSSITLILTGIGIRGGLQKRSISSKQAFIFDSYELGNLTLNSVYTFLRSLNEKKTPVETFFASDSIAKDIILKNRSFENGFIDEKRKDNVVIILVESLSQEYVDEGYTPFLDELKKKSLYFSNNYANGRRSIEVLPSVMTSLPSLFDKPLSQSKFQSNQYYALPKILKENGYQTGFFHGGKKGTMDFDAYAKSIGFERYYALEDYPDQTHFDGNWGIFDHHYLKYFADQMDKYEVPFFSSIFTLSSHQPYSIPKEFEGKFKKGQLEIHESIGYADHSLKIFFDYAKDKSWFKDTLFIITADHTSKLDTKKYNNILGRYRVPLLFYHPTRDLNYYSSDKVTQHADILPSILDYLGVEFEKRLYFGSSVFSKNNGRMINYTSGSYLFFSPPYALRYDKVKPVLFKVVDGNLQSMAQSEEIEFDKILNELKAYIQYTNNGLRNNNIYSL